MKLLVFLDKMDASQLTNCSWLSSVLWPKVCRWIREVTEGSSLSRKNLLPSLCLISSSKYGLLYDDLKTKYAQYFLKVRKKRTDSRIKLFDNKM